MWITITTLIICVINMISLVGLFSCLTEHSKKLTFDRDKKIVCCDGQKLISVREGSANFRFIDYIFNKKNQEISLSELEGVVFFGNDINLNKAISNTNLPKEIIKKAFKVKAKKLVFNDTV